MPSEVTPWSTLSHAPISVAEIQRLYVPQANYRVSRNGYDAGVSFAGTSRAGRIYVLSGRCAKVVGAWRAELGAGTFVDFPAGDFTFTVVGEEPVRLVNVWEISERYRQKQAP